MPKRRVLVLKEAEYEFASVKEAERAYSRMRKFLGPHFRQLFNVRKGVVRLCILPIRNQKRRSRAA